jgi:hypothetical protein
MCKQILNFWNMLKKEILNRYRQFLYKFSILKPIWTLLWWLLWVENFSHNDYCEQKQSIILLLVCFVFVAIVVISEKLLLQWLLWVKMKHCWNCWQLHYRVASPSSSFMLHCCFPYGHHHGVHLSSNHGGHHVLQVHASFHTHLVFFFCFLLDPYVPNRFPFPSPIICPWC